MSAIIDSYSEANSDTNRALNATTTGRAQSFTAKSSGTLVRVDLYLKKVGSPTGNATISIYAHSGTYGTSSVPTGAAIDSVAYDVSALTTSYQLITFNLSGGDRSTAETNYVVAIEYTGDASNYVHLGTDTSSPAHSGNSAYYFGGSWSADDTQDHPFYVYATLDKSETLTDDFNDNSVDTDKWTTYTANSAVVAESGGKTQITCADSTNGSWGGRHTKSTLDMTSSFVLTELTAAATGNTYFTLVASPTKPTDSTDDFIDIGVNIGTGRFEAYKKVSGVGEVLADAAYDSGVHKWMRMREVSGTTYWEYSTNGVSWTELWSEASPINLADVYLCIDDYEYNALSTPAAHTMDNFNLPPSAGTTMRGFLGCGIIPFAS